MHLRTALCNLFAFSKGTLNMQISAFFSEGRFFFTRFSRNHLWRSFNFLISYVNLKRINLHAFVESFVGTSLAALFHWGPKDQTEDQNLWRGWTWPAFEQNLWVLIKNYLKSIKKLWNWKEEPFKIAFKAFLNPPFCFAFAWKCASSNLIATNQKAGHRNTLCIWCFASIMFSKLMCCGFLTCS